MEVSTHSLLLLILVIAAAKVGGEIAEYLGQPAVLGELLVGVLLGLTALRQAASDPAVTFIAGIGIILLLFEVGLESELDEYLKVGKSASLVAVIGVVLPLFLGYLVSYLILQDSSEALFLGATLTATSVGITARVLYDLGQMNSLEATIVLGAAVIDDILGLLVLSIVLGIAASGAFNVFAVAKAVVIAVVFLVSAILIGMKFAPRIISLAQHLRTRGVLVSVAFVFCLALALAAEELGLASIIGAFAAGLVLAATDNRVRIQKQIKPLADIFIPVFFVLVGLQVDIGVLNLLDPARRSAAVVGLALFAVAVVAKLLAGFGVLTRGVDKLAVGVGMVPRGEVGIIFASVGLANGILTRTLYSELILIVFATTLITPPWLKRIFRSRPRMETPDHKEVEEIE